MPTDFHHPLKQAIRALALQAFTLETFEQSPANGDAKGFAGKFRDRMGEAVGLFVVEVERHRALTFLLHNSMGSVTLKIFILSFCFLLGLRAARA